MSMQDQMERLAKAAARAEESEARRALSALFDDGVFTEIDRFVGGDAPAAAIAGYGTVDGSPVYAFAQDHAVCCGAITADQAAKIVRVYELAAQNGAPVVGVFNSDGAKLEEGLSAMDAIASILKASSDISGVVPQVAVVAGSCVGSASLIAAAADVVIAVDGAAYRLNVGDEDAKPQIAATDVVDAMEKARMLLGYLPSNNLEAVPAYEPDLAVKTISGETDQVAAEVADEGSLLNLCEDGSIALARVGGGVCGLVTLAADRIGCCAASRAARFVRLCDCFSIPVITFVDAAAFATLKGAAKLSQAYIEATAPKISVITGKAYGAVYIAVAGKTVGSDAVLAWPTAAISPLAPETAVQLLWTDRLAAMTDPDKERDALAAEYAETECSPMSAAAGGFVTDVVAPQETKERLIAFLEMLASKRVSKLPRKHANNQL